MQGDKITILRDDKGRYVKGCCSSFKGKHHSEENKKKLSEIQKGLHTSLSTEFKKGQIPWNRGIKWWTEEIRKKQIEFKKGIHFSPRTEFKKGDSRLVGNKINLGRKHTEEWKRKNSELSKTRWKDEEYRKIVGNAISIGQKNSNFSERVGKKMKEHWKNPEYRIKQSVIRKQIWENEEHREKTIKAILKGLIRRPTSLEQKFIEIIQKYNLPYKYVGNGSFLIGFKNPDFININGDKSCIEVANRFHHQGNWAEKRKEHFKKFGWDCAVIFEDEINESKIINDLWF